MSLTIKTEGDFTPKLVLFSSTLIKKKPIDPMFSLKIFQNFAKFSVMSVQYL